MQGTDARDGNDEAVRVPGENWVMEATNGHCALKSGAMSSATGKQATFQTTQFVKVGFHKTVTCDRCFRKGVPVCFTCDGDHLDVCAFCKRGGHISFLGGNFHQITFKMESDTYRQIAFGVKPLSDGRTQGVGKHGDINGFYFTSGLPVKVMLGRDKHRRQRIEMYPLGYARLTRGDRVTLVLHDSKLECYHTSGTTHVYVGTMDNVSDIYGLAVAITGSGQKVSVVDTPARLCTGATAVLTSDEGWLALQSRLRDCTPRPPRMTGVIAALDDKDDTAGLCVDGKDDLVWVPQNCLTMRARGELACTLKEGDTVVRHPGDSGWRWGDQDGGAGSTGKVVKATDDSGWVRVKWGNGKHDKYRYGGDGKFDVMLRVEVGSRVVRNPFHWMWGNQDAGGVGTVQRIDTTKRQVHVKWDRRASTYNYRLSRTHADVQVAAPSSPPASPVEVENKKERLIPCGANWVMKTTDRNCALEDGVMSSATGKGATFQAAHLLNMGFQNSKRTCQECHREGLAESGNYRVCMFCRKRQYKHRSWYAGHGGKFHEITFKMESGTEDGVAFGVKPRSAPRAQRIGNHDDSHGFYFTGSVVVRVQARHLASRDRFRILRHVRLAKGDRVTLVLHDSKLECYHTSGTTHVYVGTMKNVSYICRFAVTITKSGQKMSVMDTPGRLCTGATAVLTSDEDWITFQSHLRGIVAQPTGTTGVIAALDDRRDTAGLCVDGKDDLQWVPQKCLTMKARGELACTLKEGDTVVRHPGDSGWRWGDQDGGAGSTGEVVTATDDSGWVSVKWGNGDTNNYRYGGDGKFDVMLRVEVGSRVVRNPFHWKSGNQDAGGVGTVLRVDTSKDQVSVKWGRDSSTYNYRLRTHADVQVVTRPSSPPASPVEVEKKKEMLSHLKPGANWVMQSTDSDCALEDGVMSSATGTQATFRTTNHIEVGFHRTTTCALCFRNGVMTRFTCTDCDDYKICAFCNHDTHRHSNWSVSLGGNFHEITFKMESDIDDLIAFGVKPRGDERIQGVGNHDDSHGFYFISGSPVKVVRGRDRKERLGSVRLAKGDRVTLVLHDSKLECYHTSGTTHVHVGTMKKVSKIYRFAVTITKSGQKVSVVDTPARLCTGATAVLTSDEGWLTIQSHLRDFVPKPTGTTGVIATLDDKDDTAGLCVDGKDDLQWVPQNCLTMRARGELACTLKEGDTVVRHPGDSGWRWGDQGR